MDALDSVVKLYNGEPQPYRYPFNATRMDQFKAKQHKASLSKQEREELDAERRERVAQRRERAKQKIKEIRPDKSQLTSLSKEEVVKAVEEDQPWTRRLGWGSDSGSVESLADSSQSYDMWQQAYRMLGGFIDCDHSKSEDDHHSGDQDQEENQYGCSRWMLWAAVSTFF